MGEPVGHVELDPGPYRGFEIGAEIVPSVIDEIPVLAVLALGCSTTDADRRLERDVSFLVTQERYEDAVRVSRERWLDRDEPWIHRLQRLTKRSSRLGMLCRFRHASTFASWAVIVVGRSSGDRPW
mgnify:CR=1 FL=1